MQQGGEPDLQTFLIKHIRGSLSFSGGTEDIQAAFNAAHQQTNQNRQATFDEFKRLYKLSPEAENLLDRIAEDDDPLADLTLDFDLVAEFLTKLPDEELEAFLYPFGR